MSKRIVTTEGAPAPAHTLSQGVAKGGLLQVSGQVMLVEIDALAVTG